MHAHTLLGLGGTLRNSPLSLSPSRLHSDLANEGSFLLHSTSQSTLLRHALIHLPLSRGIGGGRAGGRPAVAAALVWSSREEGGLEGNEG